ncbi:MAG: 50S ribosomal protein L29 [Elusimicrobiota bacterium]|jgi:large subunit ribosomal protein L29|nr:50S ribosomal protein L29 [Elusimicrobiota bacterium]
MKTKERIESKSLSISELEAKLANMQSDLFKLKFRHSVSPVKNPLSIRNLRRDIARIKTFLCQKKAETNNISGNNK